MIVLISQLQWSLKRVVFLGIQRSAKFGRVGRCEGFEMSDWKRLVRSFAGCSRWFGSRIQRSYFWILWTRALGLLELIGKDRMPNTALEATADKASGLRQSFGLFTSQFGCASAFVR